MSDFAKFVGSVVLGLIVFFFATRFGAGSLGSGIGGVAIFALCMK